MSVSMELTQVAWRKSSHSSASGDDCVEIAALSRMVAVRDSMDPDGPRLVAVRSSFRTLVAEIRAGRYDL